MSSGDRQSERAGELIERLLIDPEFRAEFRRDPAGACIAAGLPDLAGELAGSGGSMDTLMVRESRSSLAGVAIAVAVEGMSAVEAHALIHNGLAGAPRGGLSHGGALRSPLGHVHRVSPSAALQRELRGLRGGSPAHGLGGPAPARVAEAPAGSGTPSGSAPAGSAPAGSAPPGSAPAGSAPAGSAPAGSAALAAPAGSGAPPAAAAYPSAPPASPSPPPTPEPTGAAAPPSAPAPPDPGAQPAQGGVVPAWPDQPSAGGGAAVGGAAVGSAAVGAGGTPGALAALLDSPGLSAPANVRTFLASGGVDPRMASVLDSALANHTIGLGQVEAVSDPVHVQAVDIVSVDGQPVGPNNFAARDLVTEIAALDPSLRPNEIGTPWPIHSPGFFSDPSQQSRIHLAFVSAGDYAPPGGVVASAPGAVAPEAVAPAPDVALAPAAAGGGAVAPVDPSGHYVNPLPESAKIGRTDMGVDVDLNPGDAIVAPGASRVVGIMPNWYAGQPYVALQLLDGPMMGHTYYVAEQITPDVSVGQVVQQGQPIGHYAASGTGIEMGWAGSNWEQTLAQASGHDNADQGDHANTPAGISFRNFLNGLGHGGGSGAPESVAPASPAAGEVAYPAAANAQPVAGNLGPAPSAGVPLSSVVPAPVAAATPGSGADAALAYARAMIGKLPESAGSNLGPQLDRFEADFGFHGSPWCGIFAGHVLEAAGLKPPHTVAAVASILDLARNGDPPFLKGVLPVSEARPGDLVTFGGTEHVAVVTKVDAAGVHTIAGNTSQSNVSETTYSPSSVTGVVRPDYAAGKPGSIPGVWDYSGMQPPAPSVPPVGPVPEAPAGAAAPGGPAAAQPPAGAPMPMPQEAAPQEPGAFAFNEHARGGSGRHTVQFLPAVQPGPESPLYGQAPSPVAAPPAGTPEMGTAPVQEPNVASVQDASVQQPSAGGLLDQAPAPASTGGSISVSSSLLTSGQSKFAGRLAELTGLDPRVVAAWQLAEESGSAAQGREAASNFNWLNIGYFDSGAGKIAFDKTFSDPISAAEQSAKFLKGEWGGASPSIRAILGSVGHGPDAQMAAIANSDWASSHYGGGANLHGTYDELKDIHIDNPGIA